MTIRNLAFVIAALAAGGALSQGAANLPPFDPGLYPPEVRQALHYANEECKRQGGGTVTLAPDTARKLDLTGDGRTDYIFPLSPPKSVPQTTFPPHFSLPPTP